MTTIDMNTRSEAQKLGLIPSARPSGIRPSHEHLAYIERQIELCRRLTCDELLSTAERIGAQMGELDWLVAKAIAEEEMDRGSMDEPMVNLFERLAYLMAEETCREAQHCITEKMVQLLANDPEKPPKPKVKIAGSS